MTEPKMPMPEVESVGFWVTLKATGTGMLTWWSLGGRNGEVPCVGNINICQKENQPRTWCVQVRRCRMDLGFFLGHLCILEITKGKEMCTQVHIE